MLRRVVIALGLLMLLGGVRAGAAQDKFTTSAARVNLGGRMQIQLNTTSVDTVSGTAEFEFRRSRLTFDVTVNPKVRLRWMIDFTEFDEVSLRDAYANVAFSRSFRLTVGQFKRPFDVFQLQSSNRIAVISRQGDIRGVDDCNVGGLCSYDRLLVQLQFAQRDLGVMVDGTNDRGDLSYFVSMTNGTGLNSVADENGTKSFSGRVTHELPNGMRLGVNGALHDYVNDSTDQNTYAPALGADVEIGRYASGLHIFLGASVGSNWNELDATGDAPTFAGGMGLVSYYFPVEWGSSSFGLEPLARLSVSNPSFGAGTGTRSLVSTGAFLHMVGRNKVALNVDWYLPRNLPNEWAATAQVYFEF